MSAFEAGMLIRFGIAWPVSIYHSCKSRATGGKSVLFSLVVLVGYAFGILHKIFYAHDIVLYLYILNFVMVGADIVLWFRNRQIERRAETPGEKDQYR